MIEAATSFYVSKKRVVYLLAFVEYFKRCKVKKEKFVKPKFDTAKLDEDMFAIVSYAQHRHYSQALSILQSKSSEDLSHAIDRCSRRESGEPKVWLNDCGLNKFCPCVDKEICCTLRIIKQLSRFDRGNETPPHSAFQKYFDPFGGVAIS